jgi:hypothetical protein
MGMQNFNLSPKMAPIFFAERGGGRTSQKIKALSPMECVIMIADAGMFQHKRAQTNIQQ